MREERGWRGVVPGKGKRGREREKEQEGGKEEGEGGGQIFKIPTEDIFFQAYKTIKK
jgi:hypothetical protein